MSSTSFRDTAAEYYANMDTPSMVLASIIIFMIILFTIYISIEVISRRDFTIMQKTIWTMSFVIAPLFSQVFYLFFGEREDIDRFGDPTY